MSVPTHGPWCQSVTYPVTCRHCGKRVYYFSCNHGSKVFFEDLGWPWPVHDCLHPDNIILTVDFQIEEDYIRLVQENAARRRDREERPHISAYKPRVGEIAKELGIVRDIVASINVYKRYKVPQDGPWAAAMLGDLANGKYVQITIHAGDLTQQIHSYTFYVPKRDWDRIGAITGDLLEFTLEGRQIPKGDHYWLCTEIQSL